MTGAERQRVAVVTGTTGQRPAPPAKPNRTGLVATRLVGGRRPSVLQRWGSGVHPRRFPVALKAQPEPCCWRGQGEGQKHYTRQCKERQKPGLILNKRKGRELPRNSVFNLARIEGHQWVGDSILASLRVFHREAKTIEIQFRRL